MTKIVIRDVSKAYRKAGAKAEEGEVIALQQVNLEVRNGEFLSFIGPSGCGKTTLLKIIAGLLTHDAGEVQIDGVRVTGPAKRKAMVFQNFGLFPWRTVMGNVEFGLEAQSVGTKERREKAMACLELVGLEKFANNHPHELSGGMQQRVGLARALAVEPEILLMDEPFGALDAHTRELLQFELLRILNRTKSTICFVTHSVDEALVLSDRVALFSARPGRIIDVLTVDLPRPRDQAVKALPEYVEMRQIIWDALKPGKVEEQI